MRAVRLTAKISPALQALTALGQVGVLALGGYLALIGNISLGTFLAFTLYLAQLVAPTRMLTLLLVLGQQARASVERVLEIIDSLPVITERADPVPVPAGPLRSSSPGCGSATPPTIRCWTVSTCTSPPGSTVALVGASGSGKSTVSLLLPRFYDPQAGVVRVGRRRRPRPGHDRPARAVGVVFEEAFLFSDSIAANIGYGRPDATDAEIRAAAVGAEAADFIEALPDGYDTVIGERGPDAVRRPAAAAGAGPGVDHRPAGAGAGRRDQRRRPDHRGGDPRHAAQGHRRPDHDPDRAPAIDPGAGRPDRRGGRRAGSSTSAATTSWSAGARSTGTCSAPNSRPTGHVCRRRRPLTGRATDGRPASVRTADRPDARRVRRLDPGRRRHHPAAVARADDAADGDRGRRAGSGIAATGCSPAAGSAVDRSARLAAAAADRVAARPVAAAAAWAAAGWAACSAPARRPRN